MSQQTYTAVQLTIICVLTFMVGAMLVWDHPGWFNGASSATKSAMNVVHNSLP